MVGRGGAEVLCMQGKGSGKQFCRWGKLMVDEMERKGPFASAPDGTKSSKAPEPGTHLLRF